MGCDIHSVGQIMRNGQWETVVARPGGDDRNYDSFSVMADVRNGEGFAGCDTGEGWPVLFPPRGLPEGIELDEEERIYSPVPYFWKFDEEKKDPEHRIWMGDHTHSWLTLAELHQIQNRFKDTAYEIHGYVSPEAATKLKAGEEPTEWCGYTSRNDWVQVKWHVPSLKRLHTLNRMIEAIDNVAAEHSASHEDVRVVFGFDS